MQRKVTGGSVSWNKNWAEYRDGFGSVAGNDNYWLGLDKVYRLMQMGNVKLRVLVCKKNYHFTYLFGGSRVFKTIFQNSSVSWRRDDVI